MIVWLVRNHLVASSVAQKQDIADPDVVTTFAKRVKDERHLIALYLLTVADIRGTGPKVWNSWKGQLLESLFNQTRRLLRSGGQVPTQGIIQERKEEALRLMLYHGGSRIGPPTTSQSARHRLFPASLSRGNRLAHPRPALPNEQRRADRQGSRQSARRRYRSHGLHLIAQDLFARLVGFFSRSGYNILDARIHTTKHGYALDSFIMLDMSNRGNDRDMISFIEHELTERLIQQTPPEQPQRRLSRQVKHFPIQPQVTIENDAEKGAQFVLFISASDRPGLLFTVASVLASCGASLHTAKIVTLGERVEDTFLITGGDLEVKHRAGSSSKRSY